MGAEILNIGVGGLTLGGGISYFSGIYGWACDNVNNYEVRTFCSFYFCKHVLTCPLQVVFADGSINQVSEQTFPDVYYALRGGGNNFGIITRLDLASFEQGKMWGGACSYAQDTMPALIKAFHRFNLNHLQDPMLPLF